MTGGVSFEDDPTQEPWVLSVFEGLLFSGAQAKESSSQKGTFRPTLPGVTTLKGHTG